jgi:glycosyltransferase involved in cell wall biosynthesis
MSHSDVQPKHMIFHHPLPLPAEVNSGSRVRPLRLLDAFRAIGYEVTLVAGDGAERHAAMAGVRAQVAAGKRFAFLYAEPPNAPLLWLNRQQPHRLQDFSLWRWCQAQGIPVGLFYRDVHWRFEQYRAVTSWQKRAALIPLYWVDWLSYGLYVDHLFLPSLGMAAHLPTRCTISPGTGPAVGGPQSESPLGQAAAKAHEKPLRLFYVGGVQPPLYDLKPMFAAIEALAGVVLTVCCRPTEWAAVQEYYTPFDRTKIQIVHAQGEALAHYYREADLFGLFWRPNAYLDFAMPVKIFESLGYGVPIVTTAGTEAARFVANEGLGWVVADAAELRTLLLHLRDLRAVVAEQRRRVEAARHRHTWQVRAQTVADLLVNRGQPVATNDARNSGGRSAWATED